MADVIDTSEFRNGLKILIDNEPFVIVEFQHVKPGKGNAFVRTRYKSLISGRTLEKNFKSGEKVGRPDIEEKKMQYLYKEGDHFVFMDSKNYEQSHIDAAGLGDSKNFLKENMDASVLFWNGRAISVDLPNAVELRVTKCDPGRARRHRLRRDEAGHAGDRLHPERAALHQRGRRPQDRHPDRRVSDAGRLIAWTSRN